MNDSRTSCIEKAQLAKPAAAELFSQHLHYYYTSSEVMSQ